MLFRTFKNNHGFTLIEIVVVLVLISIIAAAVFQRSISTDQMNFRSQFDKIQNQVRYPQSMAMKQSEWWGFACDTNDYWIFTGTNKDDVSNQRLLPGQENIKISLADLGVTRMREITNNPKKIVALQGYGLEVTERVPLEISPTCDNLRYLQTKKEKMGHLLTLKD